MAAVSARWPSLNQDWIAWTAGQEKLEQQNPFMSQILAFAAARAMPALSASTSAYRQARGKLERESLEKFFAHTVSTVQHQGRRRWWKERRVVVVDGTGVSMPDTAANQSAWPQPGSQKPGCGFPQARVCACFCLQTGGLLSYRIGHRKNAELPLLRRQADSFKRGDILLGDKGFCSYYDVWKFKERGVDSLITLARRKPVEAASAVTKLGPNDLLIQWPKPAWNKVLSYSQEEWRALSDQLNLRQIKVNVTAPGLRAKTFYLVTTLTDATRYSADELADLYYQRWDVELSFRDIKTTMGMDVLRCRTPALVEKEILMHFTAYNAVRLLMLEAANESDESPRRMSFKSSIQALRQWVPQFSASANNRREHSRLMALLCEAIATDLVTHRPGRREPRCLQRRPKPFALLTAPRHLMKEIPHRSRYRAKAA